MIKGSGSCWFSGPFIKETFLPPPNTVTNQISGLLFTYPRSLFASNPPSYSFFAPHLVFCFFASRWELVEASKSAKWLSFNDSKRFANHQSID